MNNKNCMTTLVLAVALGLAMPMFASAKNNPIPSVRVDAPNTYIVKKGDTLWDISGKFLKDPWRWKDIWAVNPQVKNPHWIYPGDRLILCNIKGRTVVGVDQGDGCVGVERRMNGGATDLDTLKLQPQIRVGALDVAIPAVPLKDIKSWLIDGTVVASNTLNKAPYVLAAGPDGHVVAAAGDHVYVRGGVLIIGDSYGVYRAGDAYIDPETKEVLGYEARLIARGIATAVDKDVSTVELTESLQQEVRAGDKIMLEEVNKYPGIFYPTNSENVAPSRVLRVLDGIDSAAINSTIAINRGMRDNVQAGQVFAIYRRGTLVADRQKGGQMIRLPSERAGLAMVFRTFDKLSYAIVLEAKNVIKIGDELRPPVSSGE